MNKTIEYYNEELSKLAGVPCKLTVYYNNAYIDINNNSFYYTKDSEGVDFRLAIVSSNRTISHFKLVQFPGCCGICVSTGAMVVENYKNKGIGTLLNKFRQDVARHQGYTILMCTDLDNNVPQKKILDHQGFQHIYQFINKRTNNLLNVSLLKLD